MSVAPLIAIINDDPAFLEFIAAFLEEEADYRTVVWDDGVDSLTKLHKHMPDLVILDVRLGDQSVGHEILQGMRQDDKLAETPVIICTADTSFVHENRDVVTSLKADILEKPFDLEILEEKVKLALGESVVSAEEAGPVS